MDTSKKREILLNYYVQRAKSLFKEELTNTEFFHLYYIIAMETLEATSEAMHVCEKTTKFHRGNLHKKMINKSRKNLPHHNKKIYFECLFNFVLDLIPTEKFYEIEKKYLPDFRQVELVAEEEKLTLPAGATLSVKPKETNKT